MPDRLVVSSTPTRGRLLAVAFALCLALVLATRAASGLETKALPADATLARLIEQTLATLPELSGGAHLVQAQVARVSQSGAWPDPMLQLGIQNDGFKSIEVGRMETSFVSLMASQTMPWPGKTSLRESIGELGVNEARYSLARMRLAAEAFVRSGYLELTWVRERRALLDERAALWQRSLGAALARYQAGTGAQVDVLRARLELTRLDQQRAALDAQERSRLQALNRARQRALEEPIPTPRSVGEFSPASGRIREFSPERAVAQSPELLAAKTQAARAGKQIELAEKGYYPDLTFGAGFMYRGSLPPMWQLTVAAPLPVFGGSKQGAAISENRALDHAAREQARMLEQLVRLRSVERKVVFVSLLETIRLYEQALLAQSATTAEAMLTQYRSGKASFGAVLEANAGLISDREGYLQALVEAERLLIAEREISLQTAPMPSTTSGSPAMEGATNPADSTPPM